jgi:hypothetical protein
MTVDEALSYFTNPEKGRVRNEDEARCVLHTLASRARSAGRRGGYRDGLTEARFLIERLRTLENYDPVTMRLYINAETLADMDGMARKLMPPRGTEE